MDFLTALEMVGGPVTSRIIKNIYIDWRGNSRGRKGVAINRYQDMRLIREVEGKLSVPNSDFFSSNDDFSSVYVSGKFMADRVIKGTTHDLLHEEEIIIYMLLVNQESLDMFFFQFDFLGYSIEMWSGLYSFYAFIINPVTDRVFAIGYPYLYISQKDPNPLQIEGMGLLEVDVLMCDVADYFCYY